MPVATPPQYRRMLDEAFRGHYAFPAINVSSMTTANAALKGFADRGSDGIVSVSTGGGTFASGLSVKDAAAGAASIADHVHRMAGRYPVMVALHTDHCPPEAMETFLLPLVEESERRVAEGGLPLFSSHMLDASELPLADNLDLCLPLYRRMAAIGIVLEIEIGVVGGEEDGTRGGAPADKLYTTPEDMVEVYRRMSEVQGTYLLAATFGNVHGTYKPGVVRLRPEILRDGQAAVRAAFGADAHHRLVFHGGSGSEKAQIAETLDYGVVKMNVDTDTQYAFTRPVATHLFRNFDGVLKVDGEVGNKKVYDPRAYLRAGEEGMARRVSEACDDLRSSGRSLCGGGGAAP